MKREEHYGTKEGGKLKAGTFRAAFDLLPDGPVVLTIDKLTTRKSVPQNNYLHQLFRLAAKMLNAEGFGDGSPWTMEKVKSYAKDAGLYPTEEMVMPGGLVVEVTKDTAELDKEETGATIERVIDHFLHEHRIILPSPNEQQTIDITA